MSLATALARELVVGCERGPHRATREGVARAICEKPIGESSPRSDMKR
jgi:hypothetical protein